MTEKNAEFDQLRQEFLGGASDKALTMTEAAEILRIGRNAMLALCKEPGFPARKCGKEWRVSRAALFAWLQGHDAK